MMHLNKGPSNIVPVRFFVSAMVIAPVCLESYYKDTPIFAEKQELKKKKTVRWPPNKLNIPNGISCCQCNVGWKIQFLYFIWINVVKIVQHYGLNLFGICAILQSQKEKPKKTANPFRSSTQDAKAGVKSDKTTAFKGEEIPIISLQVKKEM